MLENGSQMGAQDKPKASSRRIDRYCRERYKKILRTEGLESAQKYRQSRQGARLRALLAERASKLRLREAFSTDVSAELEPLVAPSEKLVEIDLDSKVIQLRIAPGVHAWQSI